MINIEIKANQNENPLNIIRRFTKKVQGSGILPKVRSTRYSTRVQSHYKIKKQALKVLDRRAEVSRLIKLGKAPDRLMK
ncbi:MAG: 30S ribosomal protein S21 [Patescibacteria group bacterium]|nr:30S ribosomal protein S21 [Patescibacteria group bacterium]